MLFRSDGVWGAFKAAWAWISGTLWPKLKEFGSWIGDKLGSIIGGIADRFSEMKDRVAGIVTGFVDVVLGIKERIAGVGDSIKDVFKAAFNAVADLWNKTVGGFGFTIPGWVPDVGGKQFKLPTMPTFHKGGTVDGRMSGDEVVAKLLRTETVLTEQQMRALAGGRQNGMSGALGSLLTAIEGQSSGAQFGDIYLGERSSYQTGRDLIRGARDEEYLMGIAG